MSLFYKVNAFWRFIRAYEWWNYKIPIPLGIALALAGMQDISICYLFLPFVTIVASGIVLAVYASVFNDFMDVAQDKLAGKTTPMMSLSGWQRKLIIFLSVSSICLLAFKLFPLHVPFEIFILIWILYTAYSLPPVRLKERGATGVLTIAVGEHLLANLLAIFVVVEITGCSISMPWLCLVCIWSVAYGMRGIIWHQLCDLDNDIKASVSTLGVRIGRRSLQRLAEWCIFPIEVVSFLALLALSQNVLAWSLLGLYALAEFLRCRYLGSRMVIAAPRDCMRFVLLEYYQLFFPLSFLLHNIFSDKLSSILTLIFFALFPFPIVIFVHHMRLVAATRLRQPKSIPTSV